MSFKEYIKESASKFRSEVQPRLFGKALFTIKEQPDLNLEDVCKKVEYLLPNYGSIFCNYIDGIYVGEFAFLIEKQVNAAYDNGVIYISSVQDSVDDMVDDIVHEVSHAVEELAGELIYSDGKVLEEFKAKRRYLKDLLKARHYKVDSLKFEEAEYDRDFDTFLYQSVGYEPLQHITNGLFVTPYGITSLREYFATGFEEYYMGQRDYLRKLCPRLYGKLDELETRLSNGNQN